MRERKVGWSAPLKCALRHGWLDGWILLLLLLVEEIVAWRECDATCVGVWLGWDSVRSVIRWLSNIKRPSHWDKPRIFIFLFFSFFIKKKKKKTLWLLFQLESYKSQINSINLMSQQIFVLFFKFFFCYISKIFHYIFQFSVAYCKVQETCWDDKNLVQWFDGAYELKHIFEKWKLLSVPIVAYLIIYQISGWQWSGFMQWQKSSLSQSLMMYNYIIIKGRFGIAVEI